MNVTTSQYLISLLRHRDSVEEKAAHNRVLSHILVNSVHRQTRCVQKQKQNNLYPMLFAFCSSLDDVPQTEENDTPAYVFTANGIPVRSAIAHHTVNNPYMPMVHLLSC